MGGSDEPNNLRAVCSVCNEGASNVTLIRPDYLRLATQVRRATSIDQVELLKWLMQKFPQQAAQELKQSVEQNQSGAPQLKHGGDLKPG
jgi:hypothetical protein